MDPNKPGTSTTKKWLIGCGIGCGVIIVIVALLVIGGVVYIKNIVKGFEDSEAIMSVLTDRYGRITEYCPELDGTIRPDRIEAFLKAREFMIVEREKLEKSISILSEGDWGGEIDVESSGNVFQKIKIGFGLIPKIADFFKARNQALLDEGMGMGEYYYLYMITYYSWLQKPIIDGPDIKFEGDNRGYRGDWNKDESEEVRRDMVARRLHRMVLPMLHNQYDKLMGSGRTDIPDAWREALKTEIDALESNRYRLVWEDGLPAVITSSLIPYRQRLESSYSPILNTLEVSLEQN
jgi:hypothetical protein